MSMPKVWGGRGIRTLGIFSIFLCAKTLWRGMNMSNLWCNILKSKYMRRLPPESWLFNAKFTIYNALVEWFSFCSGIPVILCDIF